ncbi:MAG: methylase, partial [Selenomonadaceae bacterium]|nr:methylase [Selenomonadaceae bacterium]
MSVKEFVDDWYDGGGESGNYQKFWWTLLRDVFGVDKPERLIEFQKPVGGWHIDAYIAETKVLIEHKSFGVDLSKKIPQSDGKLLTPYEQAKRYADALPAKDKPRWIVTCNFAEFHIYDRTKNFFDAATTIIKLCDLRYQFERLKFLIDPAADTTPPAEKISKDALDVITKIYDTFAKNYQRNQVADFEDALNKICTRLVFCLYADDAKLFGDDKFFGYLQSFPHTERNFALQRIFDV